MSERETGAKVWIQNDWPLGGVEVAFIESGPPKRLYVPRLGDQLQQVHLLAEAGAPTSPATLHLPDDMARALLAALLRWYDGGEDTRSLRRDYDAERARVDRLIGALLSQATARP